MKDAQLRKNEKQHSTNVLATPRRRSPDWVHNSTLCSNEYKRWKLMLKLSKTTSSLSRAFGPELTTLFKKEMSKQRNEVENSIHIPTKVS
ncbi:hypothetical protein Hanom_Chr04g00343611 [Helianthus anomalus]